MPFLTLSSARASLWNQGSNHPFATATTAQKLEVTNLINQASLRLLGATNFRGSFATARLRVFDEQITLPSPLDGIRSLRLVNDDGTLGRQFEVFSQQANFAAGSCYYDFSGAYLNGIGDFSAGLGSGGAGIRDLGEGFPTFRDGPGTYYLRCKSTATEGGTTLLLKGLDENGDQIYSSGAEGVSLAVTTATTTTTQKFTDFSSWVKGAATAGTIKLYAVDTTTGVETQLVNITPNKLVSGYRRYSAKGFAFGATVEALCNIAIVPAVADNDPVIPGNLGALKLAMMALQFEEKNDPQHAALYWGPNYPDQTGKMTGALDILEKDRDQFDGDEVSTVPFSGFDGAGVYGGWR